MYFGHKLSYKDPNEMILISTEHRLIELQLSLKNFWSNMSHLFQKIVQLKVKNLFLGGKNISHNLTSLAKMHC